MLKSINSFCKFTFPFLFHVSFNTKNVTFSSIGKNIDTHVFTLLVRTFTTFRNSAVLPSNTPVYCKAPGCIISEDSTVVALRFRIVQVIVRVGDRGRPTLTSPSSNGGGSVSGVYVFSFAHNIAIVSFRIN